MSTPARSRSQSPSVSGSAHVKRYVFSTPRFGAKSRCAAIPSFVSIRSPVVSRSSRPHGKRSYFANSGGRMSITVLSPRASSVAETTPAGLFIMTYMKRRNGMTAPMYVMTSRSSSTRVDGSRTASPLTVTSPRRHAFAASVRVAVFVTDKNLSSLISPPALSRRP